MGITRPWKVRYHFDGTKQSADDESLPGAYTIDTTRPIDAIDSFANECSADSAAQQISRNGGTATVHFREPAGHETTIRTYQPYETALDDITKNG